MIRIIDGRGKTPSEVIGLMNRPSQLSMEAEKNAVEDILQNVRNNGDEALLEYTNRFDRVDFNSPQDMVVTEDEIKEAYKLVDNRTLEIIRKAKKRIWDFHIRQKQNSWMTFEEEGVILGQKITPLERVGVYVPGGRAAYPSSVLMNVIPARAAGVNEIIMVTPPEESGRANPVVLAAAKEAGVDRIFKVGGAHAVGALAFGTETIPKVDKIVGPGNIYVTLAKKDVYGFVDIDMIAGPSEILIIGDSSARPEYIAADLMSQAEHDPMASSILITDCPKLAKSVKSELGRQINALSHRETIKDSLKNFGALIIIDTIKDAVALSDIIAPEHLELSVESPFDLLGEIRNAGAIFLGHYSPEPVGDYMAGPNHVLPTSGTARFFSPLSVDDFVKKSSIISYTRKALAEIYSDVADFARREGLTAHANAVEVRFNKDEE